MRSRRTSLSAARNGLVEGRTLGLAADVRGRDIRRWTRPVVDAILGPEDSKELDELLADPLVVPDRIYDALRKRGIGISESAVAKWAAEARRPR